MWDWSLIDGSGCWDKTGFPPKIGAAPGALDMALEGEALEVEVAFQVGRAAREGTIDMVKLWLAAGGCAIMICRVFSLAFWSQAFAELKARSGSSFVGVMVLAVETAAVVLAVELLAASSPKSGRKKDQ